MASYKEKCRKCRKNWVLVSWRNRYALCYDCQKGDLKADIKDPKMRKFFNIPEEFYQKNSFLRNIKMSYIQYEKLTDKQIEAFKKVVEDLKAEKDT